MSSNNFHFTSSNGSGSHPVPTPVATNSSSSSTLLPIVSANNSVSVFSLSSVTGHHPISSVSSIVASNSSTKSSNRIFSTSFPIVRSNFTSTPATSFNSAGMSSNSAGMSSNSAGISSNPFLHFSSTAVASNPSASAVSYPSASAVSYPSASVVSYPSASAVSYSSASTVTYPTASAVSYPSASAVSNPSAAAFSSTHQLRPTTINTTATSSEAGPSTPKAISPSRYSYKTFKILARKPTPARITQKPIVKKRKSVPVEQHQEPPVKKQRQSVNEAAATSTVQTTSESYNGNGMQIDDHAILEPNHHYDSISRLPSNSAVPVNNFVSFSTTQSSNSISFTSTATSAAVTTLNSAGPSSGEFHYHPRKSAPMKVIRPVRPNKRVMKNTKVEQKTEFRDMDGDEDMGMNRKMIKTTVRNELGLNTAMEIGYQQTNTNTNTNSNASLITTGVKKIVKSKPTPATKSMKKASKLQIMPKAAVPDESDDVEMEIDIPNPNHSFQGAACPSDGTIALEEVTEIPRDPYTPHRNAGGMSLQLARGGEIHYWHPDMNILPDHVTSNQEEYLCARLAQKMMEVEESLKGWRDPRMPEDRRGRDDMRMPEDLRGRDDMRMPEDLGGRDDMRIQDDLSRRNAMRIQESLGGRNDMRIQENPSEQNDMRIVQTDMGWDDTRTLADLRSQNPIWPPADPADQSETFHASRWAAEKPLFPKHTYRSNRNDTNRPDPGTVGGGPYHHYESNINTIADAASSNQVNSQKLAGTKHTAMKSVKTHNSGRLAASSERLNPFPKHTYKTNRNEISSQGPFSLGAESHQYYKSNINTAADASSSNQVNSTMLAGTKNAAMKTVTTYDGGRLAAFSEGLNPFPEYTERVDRGRVGTGIQSTTSGGAHHHHGSVTNNLTGGSSSTQVVKSKSLAPKKPTASKVKKLNGGVKGVSGGGSAVGSSSSVGPTGNATFSRQPVKSETVSGTMIPGENSVGAVSGEINGGVESRGRVLKGYLDQDLIKELESRGFAVMKRVAPVKNEYSCVEGVESNRTDQSSDTGARGNLIQLPGEVIATHDAGTKSSMSGIGRKRRIHNAGGGNSVTTAYQSKPTVEDTPDPVIKKEVDPATVKRFLQAISVRPLPMIHNTGAVEIIATDLNQKKVVISREPAEIAESHERLVNKRQQPKPKAATNGRKVRKRTLPDFLPFCGVAGQDLGLGSLLPDIMPSNRQMSAAGCPGGETIIGNSLTTPPSRGATQIPGAPRKQARGAPAVNTLPVYFPRGRDHDSRDLEEAADVIPAADCEALVVGEGVAGEGDDERNKDPDVERAGEEEGPVAGVEDREGSVPVTTPATRGIKRRCPFAGDSSSVRPTKRAKYQHN